ncbi:hypothetical protein ScPMuIL_009809 [Solemya velum]
MGKELELLKAAKQDDQSKISKLLSPSRSRSTIPSTPEGLIRQKLEHIDVNCHQDKTGYTPLIIAVMNGFKEIADTLIFNSADVGAQDNKGNTALHLSVFFGRMDMVEMVLKSGAKVNVQNSDGNTPLHIACQSADDNRIKIILTILQHSPDLHIKNRNSACPLDVAAMYNKKDAVSLLLDQSTELKNNTTAIVEAAVRGYTDIVLLLLDYGVCPNSISGLKGSGPLHEAVRFLRLNAAEVLLRYGADPRLPNTIDETPISLAKQLPMTMADKFHDLFEEYKCKQGLLTPKFSLRNGQQFKMERKDYPPLPNNPSWTENRPSYCNSCTASNPNTNILDDNLTTFWVIPELHHSWTVLDLQHSHTITGVTVYGWDSPQMIQTLQLQQGQSLQGPWSDVVCMQCEQKGSSNPKDAGVPQYFKDFTASSRYWRLYILKNHGGKCICFQGVSLNGADDRIPKFLEGLKLSQYTDNIIKKGYNLYRKFLLICDEELAEIVSSLEHLKSMKAALVTERLKEFRMTKLSWYQLPVISVKEGETLSEFSVKSDPGVTGEVELCIENAVITGNRRTYLVPGTESEPSVATFTGVSIHTCGSHRMFVRSVQNPIITIYAPRDIEVVSKSHLTREMADAFAEMEAMLSDLQASLEPSN